jgi:hypothetical protein
MPTIGHRIQIDAMSGVTVCLKREADAYADAEKKRISRGAPFVVFVCNEKVARYLSLNRPLIPFVPAEAGTQILRRESA